MKKFFLLLSISFTILEAKELFTSGKISEYLNETNPYVSTLLNKEYIAKERVKYHKGAFDTTLTAKYDNKDYPASSGEYYDLLAKKKIKNGIEFTAGYRRAEGTQEYNNIKTGVEGEMLAGVKLPLNALIQGTNTYKTNLDAAIVESVKYKYNSNNNLRLFYLEVLNAYYTLLYNKLILNYENQLLEKAKNRESFTKHKIKVGAFPEISLIEVQQQIINRKQRTLATKTSYENSFTNFLKYLNISKEQFTQKYVLKGILDMPIENVDLREAIEMAKINRPDLKMLEFDKQKLNIEKKNANLLKYPAFNVALYGVHDFKYDNDGFKVALDISFPVERSRYESKIGEYTKNLQNIEQLKQKKLLEISTSLRNIINSLKLLKANIDNAEQEVTLVKKLESAENKKYLHGSSNLFIINQRETATLEVEKKVLQYKLNYLLLKEQLNAQIGKRDL